jgi:hypothetical protein
MNVCFPLGSRHRIDTIFDVSNGSKRPEAALGAYSTCNEFAAVVKRIARQLNTSLRASQCMQISGNIAFMLPILQIHQVD